MTLSWSDIDARWPDAGVMWDRDVAPTLDWEPVFVERDGILWAVETWEDGQRFCALINRRPGCRCRVWEPTLREWWSHARWERLAKSVGMINADLKEGRLLLSPDLRREYLGEFADPEPEDDRVIAMRYMYRSGKQAYQSALVADRVARGQRVLVVTPEGDVDGREWLGLPRTPAPRFMALRRYLAGCLP